MIKKCKLCERTGEEVSLLIQGERGTYVCNECIRLYADLLNQYSRPVVKSIPRKKKVLKPHEIRELLDRKVVGQSDAKKALSVALYNQELFWNGMIDWQFHKNNLLIAGPTGVGKTYLIETAAEILDIPVLHCDATTFSEVGYVGDDVSHILELLYYQADYDVKRAEKSIVFIDEIDKISRPSNRHSYGRDVSGEGVQQALLKMMEGKRISLSVSDRNGGKHMIQLDTKNILFVFCGAFIGMDHSMELSEAFIHYGMLPELIGRTPMLVQMHELTREDFMQIMTGINDSIIDVQKKIFAIDDIELEITEDALDLLVDIACEKKLGVRGLFAVFDMLMYPVRYESIKNDLKKVVLSPSIISESLKK